MPLGLFLVAYPPPPVTFPATRLSVFRRERLGTLQVDHLPRALPVFIRITPASPPADLRKPFGFDSGRFGQRLSAPSVLKRCVTTSAPLPDAGQNPRSDPDCETSLHPKKRKSSRKYFNYCPYFVGILWKSCG